MFRIHRFCDANQTQADGKVKNELLSAIRGSRDKGNLSQGEGCRLALYAINHLSVQRDGCWEDQVSLCSLQSAFQLGSYGQKGLTKTSSLPGIWGTGRKQTAICQEGPWGLPIQSQAALSWTQVPWPWFSPWFLLADTKWTPAPTTFSRLFNSDSCRYRVLCPANLYTQSYLILPAALWGWVLCLSHLTGEENKVQRDSVTCPRSHSCWVIDTGFELRPVWSGSHCLEPSDCCLSPEMEGTLMR